MTTLTVVRDKLVVELAALDRKRASNGRLSIPLEHILETILGPTRAIERWEGMHMPGRYVPGIISAGTFYRQGEKIFWDVQDPDRTISISLQDDEYSEIVIEVENPLAEIRKITAALAC